MRIVHAAVALTVSITLTNVPARSQFVEPSASTPSCELHVWPSTELKSLTENFVSNHRVNQAFDPAYGGVNRPAVLSPQRQVQIIESLDLPTKLGIGNYRVIVHDSALSRAAAANKIRHAESASACYGELLVAQIVFEKRPFAGSSLRTLGIFRLFGSAPEPTSSFMTWADHPLTVFPAKEAEQEPQATEELEKAFQQTLFKFAAFATRPPGKR